MLKNLTSMKEILHRQNSAAIYRQVSPASLLDVSPGCCQRALGDECGLIRNQIRKRSETVALQGSSYAPTTQG
jgi:hypothetical protein